MISTLNPVQIRPPAHIKSAPIAPEGCSLDGLLERLRLNVGCRTRGDWQGAVEAVSRALPDDDSDAIKGGRIGKN